MVSQERELPVFDKATMLERLMGDEELAAAILKGFLKDTPGRIEALQGHLAAGDARSADLQAHTIKGAAGYVGGNALHTVAHELERATRAGDLEAGRACLAPLEREFHRLKEAIENDR